MKQIACGVHKWCTAYAVPGVTVKVYPDIKYSVERPACVVHAQRPTLHPRMLTKDEQRQQARDDNWHSRTLPAGPEDFGGSDYYGS